jgi:PAS domain S-box-containing protein
LDGIEGLEVLSEESGLAFCRGWRGDARDAVLLALPAAEQPAPAALDRLAREWSLQDELDGSWALRPQKLVRERGRTALVFEDPGGELLSKVAGTPLTVGNFLRLATGLAASVDKLHRRGLIHKDLKPANVLVNAADGEVRLTGFGIASRLTRERQPVEPPELIGGTLAYMAPEQTGRMNRSIDSRSDLYSLGVTFYELLTGSLPFKASSPMEWVHCHIARRADPPGERVKEIPAVLSSIVMRLLAKTAEERYQTAGGLEADLRRCQLEWQQHGVVEPFALGAHDISDQLRIPEQLYGREREINSLLASFDRVVAQGTPELVLISGYSGVGKSSVVNELHKVLVPPRGLFAAGKFDQYKRDIPYATLAQAFRTLVRQLLVKSEAELEPWRRALVEAAGAHGQLIVNLVPEVELIIGKQPAVPDLPPQEAQNRFKVVFRRFLGAFARPEHPLALFLDDLQWLDAATLDLLEHLIAHPEVRHLLLVGAYRNDEVGPEHLLSRTLGAIKRTDARVSELVLAPLGLDDAGRLIAGALHCDVARARPLTRLVHQRTGGNPFFAIQFVTELAEEQLLAFDPAVRGWQWDIERIRAKSYTGNVVDLMTAKLRRLSSLTQEALKQLACLGNTAETFILSLALGETMHAAFSEAVHAGLVVQQERGYRFLHDRIHQAAYSLIPGEQSAGVHLRLGRVLLASMTAEELAGRLFEVANQMNRGLHLITSTSEREQVAALNLAAARQAKASAAFVSALNYLEAGRSLLTEQTWLANYALIFAIEALLAECQLLAAEMAAAEARLTMLSKHARPGHDFAVVTRLQLTLYTASDRTDLAIDLFLDYLRRNGTNWSKHPTREEVMGEYDRIWSLLGERQIEDLVQLPLLTDPDVIDMLDVFTEIVHPAMFYDENLSSLAVCRMVNLSLEHGNGDGSCFGYVWFAMFAGPRFDNYKDGFRFGELGYELVENHGFGRYRARTYITFSTLMPWGRHAANARELVRRASEVAYREGDLTFSAYSWHVLITNYLMVGDPLEVVQKEAEAGLAFANQQGFALVSANCGAQLGLVRMLRGSTQSFGSFDDADYDETEIERHLAAHPGLALAEFFYWTRKLQGRFFAGEYAAAVEASRRAHSLLWPASSQVETGDFRFYGALAHAAAWTAAPAAEKQHHFEGLIAHHRQLEIWAGHCPENFENRAALSGAELARVEGRELEAGRLYQLAIRSARANGFVHNEALACEVAARFYAARGLEDIAAMYLSRARNGYARWGAAGKVRQLEESHPQLAVADPRSGVTSPDQQLDAAAVVKASQALSSEIVPARLIERLMKIALENAGADRGLLILPSGNEYLIRAEARAAGARIEVTLQQAPMTADACPESLVRYVIRTRESVILDDAAKPGLFVGDGYLRDRRSKSMLCLPLLKQGELTGILLLENALTSHAFTPARIAVLELLASQAAISLENTRLYGDLQERESKVRRLVDSNIIGICICNLDGLIVEAHEAMLHIVGYGRDDVTSGRLHWTALSAPEWAGADARARAEMASTGTCKPYEKSLLRKDNSRVPVFLGGATVGEPRRQIVAFVVDLTERKRTEAELARANRFATMGQLTASIAHEVNQPLAGILANASTCLRLLAANPPNIESAQATAQRTIRDANRASEVIKRLRALFAKRPQTSEPFDLNEAAREVLTLTSSELESARVVLQTDLAGNLPAIVGDRVQLQQVLINLVLNAVESMRTVDGRLRELSISTVLDADGRVLLSVRDGGTGANPEQLRQLFDAFYTTKREGMGVGLSISRSIVEAHGGRIWAAGNDGPGLTFTVSLPASSTRPHP